MIVKLTIALIVICFVTTAVAQTGNGQIFLEDISGRPLKLKGVEDVEGSPYLFDEWKKGSVVFENGQSLAGVDLKFASFGNQLFFQKDGQVLEFTQPVKEFSLGVEIHFRDEYPATGDNKTSTFYQVLADGSNQLLKFRSKEIKEHKSYNEAVKQRFNDKDVFYVFLADKTMHLISGDKKSIVALFPNNTEAINQFITENKLKFRSDTDLIDVINYINTLKQ